MLVFDRVCWPTQSGHFSETIIPTVVRTSNEPAFSLGHGNLTGSLNSTWWLLIQGFNMRKCTKGSVTITLWGPHAFSLICEIHVYLTHFDFAWRTRHWRVSVLSLYCDHPLWSCLELTVSHGSGQCGSGTAEGYQRCYFLSMLPIEGRWRRRRSSCIPSSVNLSLLVSLSLFLVTRMISKERLKWGSWSKPCE